VAARDCLESFVTGEIDTSLFQQAQAAFSDAGLSSGSLNETLENSNQDTLEVVLDNAGRYYERIHQSQVLWLPSGQMMLRLRTIMIVAIT